MNILATLAIIFLATAAALPAGNLTGSARIDIGVGGNLSKEVYLTGNQAADIMERKNAAFSLLIPERPKGQEQAVLEVPPPIQQKDLIYDNAQQLAANVFHPKPIVDTIAEHEKYGNTGQFRSIGNAVVNGYEGFSNLLNVVVEAPFEAMRQLVRKASSYGTILGAAFVGRSTIVNILKDRPDNLKTSSGSHSKTFVQKDREQNIAM